MSASGGFFSFGRKNDENNRAPEPTPDIGATYGDVPDANMPGTSTVFTPSTPRHAATSTSTPDDADSDDTGTTDEQSERDKAMDLARHMSLPFVDLDEYQVDPGVVNMVPDELCRRSKLLPISIINGRLALAMAKPNDFAAIDDISASTGMQVIPMVATASQVQAAINRFLRANAELNELSHAVAASAKKIVDTENDEEEEVTRGARVINLTINPDI